MEITNTILYIFVYITKNPVTLVQNDSGRPKMAFIGLVFSLLFMRFFRNVVKVDQFCTSAGTTRRSGKNRTGHGDPHFEKIVIRNGR